MTTTNVTPAQADAGLWYVDGYRWSGNTITFSIPGAGAVWDPAYATSPSTFNEPGRAQYSTFSSAQGANFAAAVGIWDSYIAPAIQQVSDSTPGQIRVAFTDVVGIKGSSGVYAYAYSPPSPGAPDQFNNGDVWVDASHKTATFAQGTYDFQALLHELGHALAFKHSFEAPTVPAGYDSTTYTIMSYTSQDNFYAFTFNGNQVGSSSTQTVDFTPMVLDIQAMQDRYGADLATKTGNDTYAFTDSSLNGRQSIYDAGRNRHDRHFRALALVDGRPETGRLFEPGYVQRGATGRRLERGTSGLRHLFQ